MQEKWRDKGLVVILVHCQNVEKATVMSFLNMNGLNFSVYNGGQVKGCDFSGIPHVFAFDHKGEMAFEGTYTGMEYSVEQLLKAAPDWLAGPRDYQKVKSEADKVRKRRGMGQAAKDLRKKALSEDVEEKEEAEELLGRLERYSTRQMSRADALASSGDPLGALALLKELASGFKGDEIGNKASAAEKQKSSDPDFKKELDAAKILAKIEAMIARLGAPNPGENMDNWKKKNAGPIAQIAGLFRSLEKKHPDSKVLQRARDVVSGLN